MGEADRPTQGRSYTLLVGARLSRDELWEDVTYLLRSGHHVTRLALRLERCSDENRGIGLHIGLLAGRDSLIRRERRIVIREPRVGLPALRTASRAGLTKAAERLAGIRQHGRARHHG